MISKTFFYLTIYPALTPIVNMILTVFWDLRFLVLFYLIMLFYFSLATSVLGIGVRKEYNPEYWEISDVSKYLEEEKVDTEYTVIGVQIGNFLEMLRVSIGDQHLVADSKKYMDHGQNGAAEAWAFWIIWFICNVITAIVFLNFIVAEACESYTRVTETLDSVV